MRYDRILTEVLTLPWAITTEYLKVIAGILASRIAGERLTEAEIEQRVAAGQTRIANRPDARTGSVAVMPIIGAMVPRGEALNTSGAVSTQQLTERFDALVADPSVGAIVLDFDSPGGSVGGVDEFATRVREATATKPVVALANPMMASAAYWVGASATEIIASPTALLGSIGVYAAHEDISAALVQKGIKVTLLSAGKKKTFGNPLEPLSEEARAEIQKRVDEFYGLFAKSVARGRGVKQRAVTEGFGQGGIVGAAEAVSLMMADRIGTLDDAVASAARRAGSAPSAASSTPVLANWSGTSTVSGIVVLDDFKGEVEAFRQALAARD